MSSIKLNTVSGGSVSIVPQDTASNVTVTVPASTSTLASGTALAASSGSSLVGFLQSGTGAVVTTVQTKLRETVSVFDFMTAAQIADVQAGTALLDVTAAIQAAVNATTNGTLFFPTGTYLVSSAITIANKKIRFVGDGIRNTVIHRNGNVVGLKIEQGTSGQLTSDFGISDIQLSNVNIQLYNRISFFTVDNVSIVRTIAAARTYSGIVSTVAVSGDKTYLENVQIRNSRFYGMLAGISFQSTEIEYEKIVITNNYLASLPEFGISVGTQDPTMVQDRCMITGNLVENIGDYSGTTPPNNYVAGIRADGDDLLIADNIVKNVVTSVYWESDGIYVKQKRAVIVDNILINAGYRSAITTKQLGSDGNNIASSVLISGNQIYFDAVNTGYSGNPGGIFDGRTNVYGGINIVSYNTTVENNYIYGAGYPIYCVNSTIVWLVNNMTIQNNTIIKSRGQFGMFLVGAGERWSITGNTLRDFNLQFATSAIGIAVRIPDISYWTTGPYWVTSQATYQNKKNINSRVCDNFVDLSINSASSSTGIAIEARDSWAGGAMPTYPGSFEELFVTGNLCNVANAGAGAGYAYLIQEQPARFVSAYFDSKYMTAKTASVMPTGYGITGYRTHTASPNGVLTPYWIGDMALDTVLYKWYRSVGVTNTDWVALN